MGGNTETMARSAGRRAGPVLTAVGAAGTTAALAVVYAGAHRVVSGGGYCAGGGAYAVAHRCDRAGTVVLLFGILGILTFGALLLAGTALLRGPLLDVMLSTGGTLLGILGWNFISVGINPPHDAPAGAGLIVSGAVLCLMALGGLVPVVRKSSLRARGRRRGEGDWDGSPLAGPATGSVSG
jgi:hypothetical protein